MTDDAVAALRRENAREKLARRLERAGLDPDFIDVQTERTLNDVDFSAGGPTVKDGRTGEALAGDSALDYLADAIASNADPRWQRGAAPARADRYDPVAAGQAMAAEARRRQEENANAFR